MIDINEIVPPSTDGLYPLEQLSKAVLAFYRDKAEGQEQRQTLSKAKLQLTLEQARKLKIENDIADGCLVAMSDHVQLLSDITAAVIEQFNKAELEIPSLVALSAEDKDRISSVTKRWFTVAKQKLADAFSEDDEDEA